MSRTLLPAFALRTWTRVFVFEGGGRKVPAPRSGAHLHHSRSTGRTRALRLRRLRLPWRRARRESPSPHSVSGRPHIPLPRAVSSTTRTSVARYGGTPHRKDALPTEGKVKTRPRRSKTTGRGGSSIRPSLGRARRRGRGRPTPAGNGSPGWKSKARADLARNESPVDRHRRVDRRWRGDRRSAHSIFKLCRNVVKFDSCSDTVAAGPSILKK